MGEASSRRKWFLLLGVPGKQEIDRRCCCFFRGGEKLPLTPGRRRQRTWRFDGGGGGGGGGAAAAAAAAAAAGKSERQQKSSSSGSAFSERVAAVLFFVSQWVSRTRLVKVLVSLHCTAALARLMVSLGGYLGHPLGLTQLLPRGAGLWKRTASAQPPLVAAAGRAGCGCGCGCGRCERREAGPVLAVGKPRRSTRPGLLLSSSRLVSQSVGTATPSSRQRAPVSLADRRSFDTLLQPPIERRRPPTRLQIQRRAPSGGGCVVMRLFSHSSGHSDSAQSGSRQSAGP